MAKQHLYLPVANKDTSIFTSIHNAIIALGFIQTSDTGQMSTGSPPAYTTTGNNNYGYLVYRFDDAAQSTFPIFFRIEWRNGATTNSNALLQFLSIGTATDGAGNITSAGTAATVNGYNVLIASQVSFGVTNSTSADTRLSDVILTSDDSHLTMVYNPQLLTSLHPLTIWSIDRFRDEDGTGNTRGFSFWAITSSSGGQITGARQRWWNSTTTQYQDLARTALNVQWYINDGAATTQDGDNIPIFPITLFSPKVEHQLSIVGMHNLDVGTGQTFDVVHLGSTRRYMAWGGTKFTAGGPQIGTSSANGTIATIFE